MESKKSIEDFLKGIKKDIKEHNVLFLLKAQNEIMAMGLTTTIAKEVILKLDIKNYSSVPTPDMQISKHNIWIFGVESPLGTEEVYIKFSDRKDNQRVICLSFHIEKRPMNYPFKK